MQKRFSLVVGVAVAVVLMALTFWLQRYRLCALEESHLMLYTWPWIAATVCHVGGVAQLLASALTQFMLVEWTGPIITATLYLLIASTLTSVAMRIGMPRWCAPIVIVPCMMVMMSLGNANFAYRGVVAYALACLLLWVYATMKTRGAWRPIIASAICLAAFLALGPVTLPLAIAMMINDTATKGKKGLSTLSAIVVIMIESWLCWRAGWLNGMAYTYSPRMYYETPGTYIMQLYAWGCLALYPAVAWLSRTLKLTGKGRYAGAVVVTAAAAAAVLPLARVAFHPAIERAMQERFLAKHGRWSDILAIDYGNTPTEVFSYRTLALAHQGRLAKELRSINPQFSYLYGRNQYSRPGDAQMLSDVFYNCAYTGEARHRAFNANLVTPGQFNPEETKKLVMLNIAYGDYAVADKLLSQLDKTLFYSNWADQERTLLYDDSAVAAHPVAGALRRAIPIDNTAMSRRSTFADLRRIAINDSTQLVARQYVDAVTSNE